MICSMLIKLGSWTIVVTLHKLRRGGQEDAQSKKKKTLRKTLNKTLMQESNGTRVYDTLACTTNINHSCKLSPPLEERALLTITLDLPSSPACAHERALEERALERAHERALMSETLLCHRKIEAVGPQTVLRLPCSGVWCGLHRLLWH